LLKVTNEARDFILQLNKGTDMHSSMPVAHVFSPVSITEVNQMTTSFLVSVFSFTTHSVSYTLWRCCFCHSRNGSSQNAC